jgi:hypothetical protein
MFLMTVAAAQLASLLAFASHSFTFTGAHATEISLSVADRQSSCCCTHRRRGYVGDRVGAKERFGGHCWLKHVPREHAVEWT